MDKEIAAILNQEGFVAARGCAFKGENVWLLRTRWGIPTVKINGVGANPMRWPDGSARRVFRCRFPSAARSGQGMKRAELMTICRSVSPLASFPDSYSLWGNCPALALRYEFTRNSNVELVDALRVNSGTPRCGGKHSSSASTIFRWLILLVV